MNCPHCGRHMSAWSLGPPDHEPAWKCSNCDIAISDEEAEEIMENEQQAAAEQERFTDETLPERPKIKEIAAWLRLSRNTIYKLAREGKIPCKRVGRGYIFDKPALLEWAKPEEAT